MKVLRTIIPLALVVLALANPLGAATHGGFHYSGNLKGTFATPVQSSVHEFAADVVAGETLHITVEWFDPAADLDLTVVAPGGSCTVLPTPDTPCLVNQLGGAASRVTCPAGNDGRTLLGTSPETLTYTASVSGLHKIVVAASAGDVLVSGIDYVLTVDGGANINGPTTLNYVRADVCRSV